MARSGKQTYSVGGDGNRLSWPYEMALPLETIFGGSTAAPSP